MIVNFQNYKKKPLFNKVKQWLLSIILIAFIKNLEILIASKVFSYAPFNGSKK